MQTLKHDLAYALRAFAKRPSFTVVAVLTLALGSAPTPPSSASSTALFCGRCRSPSPSGWSSSGSNPELARQAGLPDEIPVSPGTF